MSLESPTLITPDRPIPLDSPYFQAVRVRVHLKGLQLMRGRWFSGIYRPLGIKTWSQSLARDEKVPLDTSEKRINELADRRWFDVPLWVHHPFPTLDGDATTGSMRLQSSYDLNAEHPDLKRFAREIGLSGREGNQQL